MIFLGRYSNCLIYALGMYLAEGGRIGKQKSKVGWWWHFYHVSADGYRTEFVPLVAKTHHRIFPRPLFIGRVIESCED